MQKKESKLVLLGLISSIHGIIGNVIVKSYTNPAERIINIALIDESYNDYKLKLISIRSKGCLLCKINDYNSRNQVEKLKAKKLYCLRSNFFDLKKENEFYVYDLVTKKIVNTQKEIIGEVKNIANFGAGDIIEIKFYYNQETEFFPFVKDIFPEITDDYIIFIAPRII